MTGNDEMFPMFPSGGLREYIETKKKPKTSHKRYLGKPSWIYISNVATLSVKTFEIFILGLYHKNTFLLLKLLA